MLKALKRLENGKPINKVVEAMTDSKYSRNPEMAVVTEGIKWNLYKALGGGKKVLGLGVIDVKV